VGSRRSATPASRRTAVSAPAALRPYSRRPSATLRTELLAAAREAGLDALVEVHDERELEWAAAAGTTLVGVNNRDLSTFITSLETTERLAPLRPAEALLVAESGLHSSADVRRMVAAGAQAVLIGEAFMAAPDPGAALAEFLR